MTSLLGIPVVGPSLGVPLKFFLVAPPKPGDLAGLVIEATLITTSQLGAPGDVTVRPSSDPAGVGLNISFTGIPQTKPAQATSKTVALTILITDSAGQRTTVTRQLRSP